MVYLVTPDWRRLVVGLLNCCHWRLLAVENVPNLKADPNALPAGAHNRLGSGRLLRLFLAQFWDEKTCCDGGEWLPTCTAHILMAHGKNWVCILVNIHDRTYTITI